MSEINKNNVFKNLIGVILEPKEVFERVNDNPKVWSYSIPIMITQLLIALVGLPKLLKYSILKVQETPNFSDSMIPLIKTTSTISILVGSLISPLLTALIVTVLIKVAATICKESGPFKNLFCISILSYIPMLISGIVNSIVMLFTEAENIESITTNFTLFLSSSIEKKSVIYKLFSCIDPFLIWGFILISIGTSVVFKMKMKKSLFVIFGLYIIGIIIRILI